MARKKTQKKTNKVDVEGEGFVICEDHDSIATEVYGSIEALMGSINNDYYDGVEEELPVFALVRVGSVMPPESTEYVLKKKV